MALQQRFLNYFYFNICNSIFIMLFCTLYFFPKTWLHANVPEYNLTAFFITIIYTICIHFSLISFCFLIITILYLPSILIKNHIRLLIQAIIVSALFCMLVVDIYVFHVDGVHLTDFFSTNLATLFINDLSPLLSWSRIRGIVIIWIIFCILEYIIASKIEYSNWFNKNNIAKKFTIIFSVSLLATQSVYFFTDRNNKSFYFASHLPFQYKNNLFLQNEYPEIIKLTQSKLADINYPLMPLNYNKSIKPKNIIIIAIDAWRADHFNAKDSPTLWQFSKQGTIFNNHISSANQTRHGLFGLFYGIPSSHWHSFLIKKQSPVFIDRLQQLDYQLGIFISTQVKRDKLDKTIFSKINNLRLDSAGKTPSEFDENTNIDWLNWYETRDKAKPFFSFIFYYAVHEHDFPNDYTNKFSPTDGKIKYADLAKQQDESGIKASYKISVNYVDELAGKIIASLKDSGELENTIVIITSDHGHQLNDNKQYIWGHGSNFTEYQLKVPFAIVGAEFNKNVIENKLTTHYDVVATLMPTFLGVTNNVADYSIGRNLLENTEEQQSSIATTCLETMANSMLAFGLVSENQSIKIFPSGKYQLIDKNNKLIDESLKISHDYISNAIKNMTRFLK